jgi:hypothetical protein
LSPAAARTAANEALLSPEWVLLVLLGCIPQGSAPASDIDSVKANDCEGESSAWVPPLVDEAEVDALSVKVQAGGSSAWVFTTY